MASPFDAIIQAAAAKYGVDPELIMKMIQAESSGRPDAVSPRGAQGLMQLMPDAQKDMGVTNPMDPEQNIHGGTRYLSEMMKRFGGDQRKALGAYNFGPGNVEAGKPFPPETLSYLEKILGPAPPSQDPTPFQPPVDLGMGVGAPPPGRVTPRMSAMPMMASGPPTGGPPPMGAPSPRAPMPQPMPPPPPAANPMPAGPGMWDKIMNARDEGLSGLGRAAGPFMDRAAGMGRDALKAFSGPAPVQAGVPTPSATPEPTDFSRPETNILGMPTPPPPTPDSPAGPMMADRAMRPAGTDYDPIKMLMDHLNRTPNPADYKPNWKQKLGAGLIGGLISGGADNPMAGVETSQRLLHRGYDQAVAAHHQKGETLGQVARYSDAIKDRQLNERQVSSMEKYHDTMGKAATERADKYGTAAARKTGAQKPIPVQQQNQAWQNAAEEMYGSDPRVRKYVHREMTKQGPVYWLEVEVNRPILNRKFSEEEQKEREEVLKKINEQAGQYTSKMVDPYDRSGFGVPPEE